MYNMKLSAKPYISDKNESNCKLDDCVTLAFRWNKGKSMH